MSLEKITQSKYLAGFSYFWGERDPKASHLPQYCRFDASSFASFSVWISSPSPPYNIFLWFHTSVQDTLHQARNVTVDVSSSALTQLPNLVLPNK